LTNDSRLPELSKQISERYNEWCAGGKHTGDRKIRKERGAVFMLSVMETGQALYVLAGICALGIITRLLTRNLYKRLMKESTNLATAKNKGLKELKQRAETSYHVNQGMRDSGSWLEHQLGELHFRGMTLAGWTNLSTQLTWLCLLAGGAGAFYAYWNRMDTYYIILYGGGAVLLAMLTMLFDGGIAASRRDQLIAVLQDYLENTMFPRMGRISERMDRADRNPDRVMERGIDRNPDRNIDRPNDRVSILDRAVRMDAATVDSENDYSDADHSLTKRAPLRRKRQDTPTETAVTVADSIPMSTADSPPADSLKRGLEQIAASRERNRQAQAMHSQSIQSQTGAAYPSAENLLKELSPNDLQIINDILKQYLT
jgi:hypothetical protein